MEIKTSKVVIDLGNGQEIKLTIQQAHELRDLLCNHFPKYSGYYYYPWNPPYTIWSGTSSGWTDTTSTTAGQNMMISPSMES